MPCPTLQRGGDGLLLCGRFYQRHRAVYARGGLRQPKGHLLKLIVVILAALEKALAQKHGGALEHMIGTLGEVGNAQTFDVLIKLLAGGPQLSFNVARKIFAAVVYLAEGRQVDPIKRGWLVMVFAAIRLAYPALVEEVNEPESRIQSILTEGDQESGRKET